ncbi:nitrate reductase cytochrome c-type subunit [Microvirga terricola]|uniref:Periplasmic nitrate reductase, electron transfer subunit n=1 Tax=Microvirga terricola TaxID=2719797 RepID=A0ABX0V7U2_9HYPH|nr:nitrate reductase cytochrome c-type subunit [Microvirga terricola]NIX75924.1 nitrate reductase cytochrome c-type subunit [Microvirga terricola]
MRRQNRSGRSLTRSPIVVAAAILGFLGFAVGAISADGVNIVPPLTGAAQPMSEVKAPPPARPIVDDVRRMRNYPEQPPVIPHSIDGYQLTLNTNRCLSCHKREFTEGSGAPMISITHFMDRDSQVLSDVTPRRYFCTQCHVVQSDARPLVPNTFQDMKDIGQKQK